HAGLATASAGFAIRNNVLVIAGTLDGFSAFILSILMCKAMNRSVTNVLFGAFGAVAEDAGPGVEGVMREVGPDDVAVQLAYARQGVFVPGYGMAPAQAPHAARELDAVLEPQGVHRKKSLHPP